jgi:coproporphyrinogen III oxidase
MDKLDVSNYFKDLQERIVFGLEELDGVGEFETDNWKRDGGGGGITRIIQDGAIFEKGGVNFSEVNGVAPPELLKTLEFDSNDESQVSFYATGVSIVMHPINPMVPIIHMNVRYFELRKLIDAKQIVIANWFGGGIDLTPHYLCKDDASLFHTALKNACDTHDLSYYSRFKDWADNYFYIKHRNETRGVGGVFFDRMSPTDNQSFLDLFSFVKSIGECFLPTYSRIVQRKKGLPYTDIETKWQNIRRGRYVEFNLVYDRGTTFGLQTNGRTESILMSLPKNASWFYDFKPDVGSEEENTVNSLQKGIDWINQKSS